MGERCQLGTCGVDYREAGAERVSGHREAEAARGKSEGHCRPFGGLQRPCKCAGKAAES